MSRRYFFAFVRVPRWDVEEISRLAALGIVPTFERDAGLDSDGERQVSLRLDADTQTEAHVLLIRAFNNTVTVLS